jgi:hypothetical protein
MNASLITVLKVASCFEISFTRNFDRWLLPFWKNTWKEVGSKQLSHPNVYFRAAIVLAAEKLMVHDAVKDDLT